VSDDQPSSPAAVGSLVPETRLELSPYAAAAQDVQDSSGCICNMPETAEKSGMASGSAKVALQD